MTARLTADLLRAATGSTGSASAWTVNARRRSADRCGGGHVARQPDAGAHGEEGQAEDQHDGGGQQGGSEERHDSGRDAGILSCLAAASCRPPVVSQQPPDRDGRSSVSGACLGGDRDPPSSVPRDRVGMHGPPRPWPWRRCLTPPGPTPRVPPSWPGAQWLPAPPLLLSPPGGVSWRWGRWVWPVAPP